MKDLIVTILVLRKQVCSCKTMVTLPSVSFSTVCLILLFSQYLSKVDVPLIAYKEKRWKVFQYPLFKLFSVSHSLHEHITMKETYFQNRIEQT